MEVVWFEHRTDVMIEGRRMLHDHFLSGCMQQPERGTLELSSILNGKRPSTRKDWIKKVQNSGRSSPMKDAECWSCRVSLMANDHRQGRTGSKKYKQ
jgi:hypothetical protein